MQQDETIANIETDKVTIPVNCPESGLVVALFANSGDTVQVGSDLFKIDTAKSPPKETAKIPAKDSPVATAAKGSAPAQSKTAAAPIEPPHHPTQTTVEGKGGNHSSAPVQPLAQPSSVQSGGSLGLGAVADKAAAGVRSVHREKLSRMRARIAERMKESQNSAAALTTFNEIDMSALIALRTKYKDDFHKKHSVKFGFMSPFVKACAQLLSEIPVVNARIDLEKHEIIYHDYVDISIAVATPKGLVTPVIRNCEIISMVEIERTISALGESARDNKISLEELTGGTFTISNGGVFGSMMGTPIINSPQSAILGMHAIKDRPVAVDGKIEIRPMMYVALTYDHRLIDGREAATFLVRLKQLLEDPQRFLLDL